MDLQHQNVEETQLGAGVKTYASWDALPHPNSTHFARLINSFVKHLVCTYYVPSTVLSKFCFDDPLLL